MFVQDLQVAVIEMATNKTTFPNVMRHIPSLWAEVENYLDDRGYVMQVTFFLILAKNNDLGLVSSNATGILHY